MKYVRRHPEGMLTDENYHTVGVTGFEPATTWSQTRCATGLRYAPNIQRKVTNFFCINQIIFIPFGSLHLIIVREPKNRTCVHFL